MSAYVIVEIEVDDPVGYQEYRPLAAASVARPDDRRRGLGSACGLTSGESRQLVMSLVANRHHAASPKTVA
jgi:hypothetical protein